MHLSTENLKDGDLLLAKNELFPTPQWTPRRIIQTYSGSDGYVIVSVVKAATGEFKCPIQKLCTVLFE